MTGIYRRLFYIISNALLSTKSKRSVPKTIFLNCYPHILNPAATLPHMITPNPSICKS